TRSQLSYITVAKLVVQPLVAWVIGGPLLGYDGLDLFAIVVTSALPTAQNVYIYSMQYRQSEALMRDAVFITTVLAVPALVVIAALLGCSAPAPERCGRPTRSPPPRGAPIRPTSSVLAPGGE